MKQANYGKGATTAIAILEEIMEWATTVVIVLEGSHPCRIFSNEVADNNKYMPTTIYLY